MINDKVKALVEINPQEPLIFTFFDTPFFLFVSFFLYPLHLFKDKPSLFLRDSFEMRSRFFFYKQERKCYQPATLRFEE